MNILLKDTKAIVGVSILFFIVCLFISISFEGTGDSGDSVSHYLYARYAFQHPENFVYQWAKPLFVLFAAPFAQFGFVGIKIFNSLNAALTLFLTYKITQKLQIAHSWLVVLILASCSMYFTLIFSGLTEHFSAFLLVLATYFYLNERYAWATIIISFLPFARSEGLLILGVTGLYLVFKKQYKMLFLLLTGHVVYSIAGFFVHKDFLWVFNKISYLSLSAYGKGQWYHFFEQLYYASGLPQYILFYIGIGQLLAILVKRQTPQYNEKIWLIYGYFFVLIIAHSLFWYLGIFNSYGLPRVMNTVMPQFSIIVLFGFNSLIGAFKSLKLQVIVKRVLIALLIIIPFTNNPAAIHFPRDFVKSYDQIILTQAVDFIKKDLNQECIFYSNPCVPFFLDIDPFDTQHAQLLYNINGISQIPTASILIWDNLFSVIDHGFSLEKLRGDVRFEEVRLFEDKEHNKKFVIFKKRESIN